MRGLDLTEARLRVAEDSLGQVDDLIGPGVYFLIYLAFQVFFGRHGVTLSRYLWPIITANR